MPDRFQEEDYGDAITLSRRRRELWAEPFFTTQPPCVDCGHPLSECACGIPHEPVCPDLYPQLIAARNVREIHRICQEHRLECAACGGWKQPGRETGPDASRARKAA